jgi:hypothetical protein
MRRKKIHLPLGIRHDHAPGLLAGTAVITGCSCGWSSRLGTIDDVEAQGAAHMRRVVSARAAAERRKAAAA